VEYIEWAPRYDRIRAEFGFPFERELAAADLLDSLLPASAPEDPLSLMRPLVEGRTAVVVGLAPRSGPPPLWRLPPTPRAPVLIAADGATATCLDAGLVPAIVVTDLDGPVAAEVAANRRGSIVVVHAHGDNREALEEWVGQFPAGSWGHGPAHRDPVSSTWGVSPTGTGPPTLRTISARRRSSCGGSTSTARPPRTLWRTK